MSIFLKNSILDFFRIYENYILNKIAKNLHSQKTEFNLICSINLKLYFLTKYFIFNRGFIFIDKKIIDLLLQSLNKSIQHSELRIFLEGTKYKINFYLILYDFLRYFGLYYSALPFRDKAIDIALMIKDDSSKDYLKYYIPAIIEKRKYDQLKKIVSNTDFDHKNSAFRDFFTQIIERKIEIRTNSNFSEFINSRKIAIVTPGSSKNNDGKEIDSYDIVVRFNKINTSDIDTQRYGHKINITYTNNENTRAILDSLRKGVSITSNFICFRSKRYFASFPKDTKEHKNIRFIDNYNNLCFHQSFNLLQLALLDILFNGTPEEVKIYKSDIMLSFARAENYLYPGHPAAKDGIRSFNFSKHDPISNFIFLKNFYHIGLFKADKRMEKVLDMSVSKYCQEMQKIYSN